MRATTGPVVPRLLSGPTAAGAARTSTRPTACATTAVGSTTAIGPGATGGTRGGRSALKGWMIGAATDATAIGAGATDRGNGAVGIGIASAESGRGRESGAGGTSV